MRHGSLFSGIGGFDLGFERAGIQTIWQVEIDPYCRRVLERHFPHAVRFNDIRDCGAGNLPVVDILSGGFPCQDISNAGKRAGIDGERSGLWSEYARIIRELRPRYVVVENVAALLHRGMERVLGDLAACGYDAEWQSIRASDVGAPHRRERIWIVAYPRSDEHESQRTEASERRMRGVRANHKLDGSPRGSKQSEQFRGEHSDALQTLSRLLARHAEAAWAAYRRENASPVLNHWQPGWEDGFARVANGVPARVGRLRGLGNAIVPQIAEWIGRRILSSGGH